jgi:hypothetical protein
MQWVFLERSMGGTRLLQFSQRGVVLVGKLVHKMFGGLEVGRAVAESASYSVFGWWMMDDGWFAHGNTNTEVAHRRVSLRR